MGKAIEDTRDRLRALVSSVLEGQKGDKGPSSFCGVAFRDVFVCGSPRAEISDNVVDVDRHCAGALLGTWAIRDHGCHRVKAFAGQVQKEGRTLPPVIEEFWLAPQGILRIRKGTTTVFDIGSGTSKKVEEPKGVIILKSLKDAGREVERNSGASLSISRDGWFAASFTPR